MASCQYFKDMSLLFLTYKQIYCDVTRPTERSNSSGLMVPEQSSLRRHSTGNAALSPAALKSLRDAAAAAQDVKNKLTENRRPSYGRLPIQQQQQQQMVCTFCHSCTCQVCFDPVGRGGGLVVSVLAYYSDDPSLNPAD